MEIKDFKVGELFLVDPYNEFSKFKHKNIYDLGCRATAACLFDQDKYTGYGAVFKLVDIIFDRSLKNLFRHKVKYYIFECIEKDDETFIDRDYRMAKNNYGKNCRRCLPINRNGKKMTKPDKILKCYHEKEPCHTNLCPKFGNMDKYKNGMCHLDNCKAYKKYCACIHPDNSNCPECGERLR